MFKNTNKKYIIEKMLMNFIAGDKPIEICCFNPEVFTKRWSTNLIDFQMYSLDTKEVFNVKYDWINSNKDKIYFADMEDSLYFSISRDFYDILQIVERIDLEPLVSGTIKVDSTYSGYIDTKYSKYGFNITKNDLSSYGYSKGIPTVLNYLYKYIKSKLSRLYSISDKTIEIIILSGEIEDFYINDLKYTIQLTTSELPISVLKHLYF